MSLQAKPDADIEKLFRHENQGEHASLSDQDKLQSRTKLCTIKFSPAAKEASVVVPDMEAFLNIVQT
jgi:hypothetical protein